MTRNDASLSGVSKHASAHPQHGEGIKSRPLKASIETALSILISLANFTSVFKYIPDPALNDNEDEKVAETQAASTPDKATRPPVAEEASGTAATSTTKRRYKTRPTQKTDSDGNLYDAEPTPTPTPEWPLYTVVSLGRKTNCCHLRPLDG